MGNSVKSSMRSNNTHTQKKKMESARANVSRHSRARKHKNKNKKQHPEEEESTDNLRTFYLTRHEDIAINNTTVVKTKPNIPNTHTSKRSAPRMQQTIEPPKTKCEPFTVRFKNPIKHKHNLRFMNSVLHCLIEYRRRIEDSSNPPRFHFHTHQDQEFNNLFEAVKHPTTHTINVRDEYKNLYIAEKEKQPEHVFACLTTLVDQEHVRFLHNAIRLTYVLACEKKCATEHVRRPFVWHAKQNRSLCRDLSLKKNWLTSHFPEEKCANKHKLHAFIKEAPSLLIVHLDFRLQYAHNVTSFVFKTPWTIENQLSLPTWKDNSTVHYDLFAIICFTDVGQYFIAYIKCSGNKRTGWMKFDDEHAVSNLAEDSTREELQKGAYVLFYQKR